MGGKRKFVHIVEKKLMNSVLFVGDIKIAKLIAKNT